MGASDRVIYSVIVEQALWMAIIFPAWFFAFMWSLDVCNSGHHNFDHANNCDLCLGITVLMCRLSHL